MYFAFDLHVVCDVLDIAGDGFNIAAEKIIGELTRAVRQRSNLAHQSWLSEWQGDLDRAKLA